MLKKVEGSSTFVAVCHDCHGVTCVSRVFLTLIRQNDHLLLCCMLSEQSISLALQNAISSNFHSIYFMKLLLLLYHQIHTGRSK